MQKVVTFVQISGKYVEDATDWRGIEEFHGTAEYLDEQTVVQNTGRS